MIIAVPKERKILEKRVALTPDGAGQLITAGHQVLIEKAAGQGSFFEDSEYQAAGCKIVETLAEVWSQAELLVKVKEPAPEEYPFFREDLIVFDYLHLASFPEVAEELIKSKMTAIAYGLVQTEDSSLPCLEPMSVVAGKLAVQIGAHYLLAPNGGRATLLGGALNVAPANVTVIGAGVSGNAATQVAHGMGANINVLDINQDRLDSLTEFYPDRLSTYLSTDEKIHELCAETDLLILAVLIPGAKAPVIVTRKHVKSMPAGSVLIDISIDQGGAAETIRPTSLEDPIYIEEGVIHYAVPNMPAQVARTATKALTQATLPYILQVANQGFEAAINNSSALRNAVNTYQGAITNKEVAEALGYEYQELSSLN